MRSIGIIERDFLAECKVDCDGLWFLVSLVKDEYPDETDENIQKISLDIIFRNLANGKILAGDINHQGKFVRWELTPEETVERIKMEWNKLEDNPYIVCLTSPD